MDPVLAPPIGAFDLDDRPVPLPSTGRIFSTSRRVRLGDVTPNGRLRLDALARFVQDVSNDDTVDAGLRDDMAWVVRRTVVEMYSEARLRERLELETFCGGVGRRWAERRVSVRGEHGAHVETATTWVHLDLATGRPIPLPDQFHELYAEAAAGRVVRARLRHANPPPADGVEVQATVHRARWPLRFSDFDVMDHVNNAVAWAAVEEERVSRRHLRAPVRAEIEHRAPIERGDDVVRLAVDHHGGGLSVWLVDGSDQDRVFVSSRVVPLPG